MRLRLLLSLLKRCRLHSVGGWVGGWVDGLRATATEQTKLSSRVSKRSSTMVICKTDTVTKGETQSEPGSQLLENIKQ